MDVKVEGVCRCGGWRGRGRVSAGLTCWRSRRRAVGGSWRASAGGSGRRRWAGLLRSDGASGGKAGGLRRQGCAVRGTRVDTTRLLGSPCLSGLGASPGQLEDSSPSSHENNIQKAEKRVQDAAETAHAMEAGRVQQQTEGADNAADKEAYPRQDQTVMQCASAV